MSDLETLAQLPSRSDPKKIYTVKRNPLNGVITCDCPGWIFSKREPRSCRHTLVFEKLFSSSPIIPGKVITVEPTGRILSAAEVDQRNRVEFGTDKPAEAVMQPNVKSVKRKKLEDPKRVIEESTVRMTIRTITFEDE